MRLPSLRDPRSFYDVFTVVVGGVVLLAIVLRLTDSSVVRIETLVFVTGVLLWAVWAVYNILEHAARGQRGKP